jgi:hypothetical protein
MVNNALPNRLWTYLGTKIHVYPRVLNMGFLGDTHADKASNYPNAKMIKKEELRVTSPLW